MFFPSTKSFVSLFRATDSSRRLFSLAICIIALGLYSFFKKDMGQNVTPKNRDLRGFIIGGVILFLIGVFSGSLAAGSGLFVTMLLISWFGIDFKQAVVYTMALVGFLWNFAGAMTLLALGQPIKWSWMPVLWVAAFAGGWIGAHFGHLKGNTWIKHGFVIVTLATGTALLFK